MDTKNWRSKHVCWAQEFSCYYFQINYFQDKANGAALFQYPKQNAEEEKFFPAKNDKILHRLKSLLTNASLLGLTFSKPNLSYFHQIVICETTVFS